MGSSKGVASSAIVFENSFLYALTLGLVYSSAIEGKTLM
jgi:hypothetical protein